MTSDPLQGSTGCIARLAREGCTFLLQNPSASNAALHLGSSTLYASTFLHVRLCEHLHISVQNHVTDIQILPLLDLT